MQHLNIQGGDVLFDNAYFQPSTTKNAGVQIDYLIVDKFNSTWLCEIKFSKNPISASVIKEIQYKIQHLNIGKQYSIRPVLIHVNGVTDELLAEQFFASIIDFGTLCEM